MSGSTVLLLETDWDYAEFVGSGPGLRLRALAAWQAAKYRFWLTVCRVFGHKKKKNAGYGWTCRRCCTGWPEEVK